MVIGVTGNSGAGKSFLVKNIEAKHFLIDADKIGHDCLLDLECKNELLDYFGLEILDNDNNISRVKLGNIVFNDKEKLVNLTNITHKHIIKKIKGLVEENNGDNKLVIIDAPLLIEANLQNICDKTILITAKYENKVENIMKRDGITKDLAEKRLKSQTKDEIQQKNVDIVFENRYNLKIVDEFNSLLNILIKGVY